MQESQQKYQEGMSALAEAQRIEGEEAKRIDTINQQLNTLRLKEKEMTEVMWISLLLSQFGNCYQLPIKG